MAAAANIARDELDAYLRPLIATRREKPGSDLISTLATTTVEGERLTDEQIVRFAMLMVFAGGETTEKGLSTTLRNLLAHPDALAAVRRGPVADAACDRRVVPLHRADPHGAASDARGDRRSPAARCPRAPR